MKIDFDEITRYYYWEEISNYKKIFVDKIFPVYKELEMQTLADIQKRFKEEMEKYGDDEGSYAEQRDISQYDEHHARLITYKALTMALTSVCGLWEQQLFDYANDKSGGNSLLNEYRHIKPFYLSKGIDIENDPKITELRALVNTIKHGKGKSANDLRAINTDYFTKVDDRIIESIVTGIKLNIQEKAVVEFCDVLIKFWQNTRI